MRRRAGFVNVDLEVGARLYEHPTAPDADTAIANLAATIEALDGPARRAWNRATVRDFDVGFEIGRGIWASKVAVGALPLRRVAALGGRVVFTAYQLSALRNVTRGSRRRSARRAG